jgi:catechol-2,3-dioxygenase
VPFANMCPQFAGIDHIHVFVSNRVAAEDWYLRVLGLKRAPELESWATGGGPLTVTNDSGSVHLALFERPQENCTSTIALGAGGTEFLAWRVHLQRVLGRGVAAVDHKLAWSMYFEDPDGNPFEVTTYEYDKVAAGLPAGSSA